ncbi:unnamed protein product, partial [Mycena citricolor]
MVHRLCPFHMARRAPSPRRRRSSTARGTCLDYCGTPFDYRGRQLGSIGRVCQEWPLTWESQVGIWSYVIDYLGTSGAICRQQQRLVPLVHTVPKGGGGDCSSKRTGLLNRRQPLL